MTYAVRPLLGLTQGILLYFFIEHLKNNPWFSAYSPKITPFFIAMSFVLLSLQIKLPTKDTLKKGLSLLIAFAALYAATSYHLFTHLNNASAILMIQLGFSAFIFFIFYCGIVEEGRLRFPYDTLFNQLWQVLLKLSLGKLLVLLTWGLCALAGTLFQLLSITTIQTFVKGPVFICVLLPFFFGISMEILNQHEDILTKLRNIVLAFCKWLYPLFTIINLCFLLTVPFTTPAFSNYWNIIIILEVIHLILFNGIFQNGPDKAPYSRWFCYIIYASLLITFGYSVYVLKFPLLNMAQDKYSFFLLLSLSILTLYYFLYTLAIIISRHAWLSFIKKANTFMALFIAVMYVGLAIFWV